MSERLPPPEWTTRLTLSKTASRALRILSASLTALSNSLWSSSRFERDARKDAARASKYFVLSVAKRECASPTCCSTVPSTEYTHQLPLLPLQSPRTHHTQRAHRPLQK